jgi:hypothetical protein
MFSGRKSWGSQAPAKGSARGPLRNASKLNSSKIPSLSAKGSQLALESVPHCNTSPCFTIAV